jgi:hypothetical protein
VYRPAHSAVQPVIVEWDGKKLKESNGELDDDQHLRKQQGMPGWKDLLRKDDRTIIEDCGSFWGEL